VSDGTARRIALVANTGFYIGPPLARLLADRGHDLVIGDPMPGLVEDLESRGAAVEVVNGVRDLAEPGAAQRLVDAGLQRFGRIDSATAFTGRVVTGRFLQASIDDLHRVVEGCLEAPFHFLQAVVAPMVAQGDGQVLLLTSATGARPEPNAPLYSSVRAAANMLVRNVAADVASKNVQVNALGTNFMDFPEFRRASGADDPEMRARIEAAVPQRRLGTVEECAAFCAVFVDGSSRFTTGQFVGYAGGWV
jgi:NAD(P)-dependent dehydrogenase (short-subunit alcohol dehydrogenase family)